MKFVISLGLILFSILNCRTTKELPKVINKEVTVTPEVLKKTPLRDVVVVGNNWDGSIDIFDPKMVVIFSCLVPVSQM